MGANHSKNEVEVPMLECLLNRDPGLRPFEKEIRRRFGVFKDYVDRISKEEGGLSYFASSYEEYGMVFHSNNAITCREWAPGAEGMYLMGDFNGWDRQSHPFVDQGFGRWLLQIPAKEDGSSAIPHLSETKLLIRTQTGDLVERISPWAKYVVPAEQKPCHVLYRQLAWNPEEDYKFRFDHPRRPRSLRIYECHIGIATTEPKIGTYREFAYHVIPRIVDLGYNAIQLMAIMEHAYYASFGYHVTSYYAPSSRFGTPEDLKYLIDVAHEHELYVLLDVVHSHASKNVLDGLNQFDGTNSCFFHDGPRGEHTVWDSRIFNYSEMEVLRFLLSNLRWYVEEYRFDGFRFDGVTSMIFHSRGIGEVFTGNYNQYFGLNVDCDGILYLMLANYMLHDLYPQVITVAEEVSGMPGCCRPVIEGGLGFDYRLAMGIPDMWIKLVRDIRDEEWSMGEIVSTLTNRRPMEKTVAYAESHDQAIVGDKTIAFWLMDKEMYTHMSTLSEPNVVIDRGIALHKMIRLITHSLGGEAYLNFIGNEFGHPEWLDFPREGNNESYEFARRRWDLVSDDLLRYKFLNCFDREMNRLESFYRWLSHDHRNIVLVHEQMKVIAYERRALLFVFNFHPSESFSQLSVSVSNPGVYKIVLCTDDSQFGGFRRVDTSLDYQTMTDKSDKELFKLMMYLPSRTALVFARNIVTDEDPLRNIVTEEDSPRNNETDEDSS